MRNILGTIFIGVLFLNCASAMQGESFKNDQENTVFSDGGSVSFQNDQYLLIGSLVNNLQRTLEIWSIPDSQGIPKIATTSTIRINEPISLFLVYAARTARINMTYDFKMSRPDGTFFDDAYNGLEIAKRDVSDELIYRARQLPTIVFDEENILGKYQFHITVYDNNILIVNIILEFDLTE
jgi:uncharacterized protein with PQ loop repeat